MRERDIFNAALDIADPAARSTYLDKISAGNPGLRQHLDELLAMHAQLGSFLEAPAAALAATVDDPIRERPGTMIGPYKLLEEIGEGGMGLVFVAEQQEPIKRRVALKIIKPGMDSRQVIARFEAERQALALMDHPHIAKVHDGGTTPEGRPYFVMELVKGTPITDYCDRHRLGNRQRLELFLDVCHAVLHAHQKGIIHRDLKPSNVLVEVHDVRPVVKVIDFGIAKAIGQQLTEKTVYTNVAQMVGTPLYMSPEQAGQSSLDVDTRSDVYSLGVLLYELLTGTTPFDREQFKNAGYDEMRRIVRDDEPPRPSTRLSTMQQATLSTIAERRGQEPRRLSQQLRGELDWIAMKALEKDRNRRYESASAFAADVQRYLNDEAVVACPPTAVYKIRKFARKNRTILATAGGFVLLLATATLVSIWQAIRATRAETKARQAQTLAEERFDLAKDAVDKYLNEVTETPELKIANFHALRKKLLEMAMPFYQRLAEQEPGDPEREAARGQAYERLGEIHLDLEEYKAALVDYEAMHAIFAQLAEAFPGQPGYRRDASRSLHGQGLALKRTGRSADAAAVNHNALTIVQQLADDFPSIPEYQGDLALLLEKLGKYAEAETAYHTALTEQQRLADKYTKMPQYRVRLANWHHGRANVLRELGRQGEAEAEFRAALREQRRLADEHPNIPGDRSELEGGHAHLGDFLLDLGKQAQAEAELHAAFKELQRLTNDHPNVPDYHQRLAWRLRKMGRPAEAAAEYRAAIKHYQRLADEHSDLPIHRRELVTTLFNFAKLWAELGDWAEAEAEYRTAVQDYQRLAHEHPNDPLYRAALVFLHCGRSRQLFRLGQSAEAEGEYRSALKVFPPLGDENPDSALYHHNLARELATWPDIPWSHLALAVAHAKKAVELAPGKGTFWNMLGVAQYRNGEWKAAIEALMKSVQLRNGGDSLDFFFLAMTHWQLNDKDKARDWYNQAVAWMGINDPQDEALKRFRAEAAALLGLSKTAEEQKPKE